MIEHTYKKVSKLWEGIREILIWWVILLWALNLIFRWLFWYGFIYSMGTRYVIIYLDANAYFVQVVSSN